MNRIFKPLGDCDTLPNFSTLTFPRPDDFSRVSVLCRRKRVGAVLSVPVRAQRQDTLVKGDFAKRIVKHIDIWFAFAQRLGFGIEQMEEIILVTGRDRTKSWTNVAFLGCQAEAQVTFAFRVVEGSGDGIEWQVAPGQIGGAVLAQGPSGQVRKFPIASIKKSEPLRSCVC
jgi:hypothetical protein